MKGGGHRTPISCCRWGWNTDVNLSTGGRLSSSSIGGHMSTGGCQGACGSSSIGGCLSTSGACRLSSAGSSSIGR